MAQRPEYSASPGPVSDSAGPAPEYAIGDDHDAPPEPEYKNVGYYDVIKVKSMNEKELSSLAVSLGCTFVD